MITDGLISLPLAVLSFLIGLLPSYSGLPTGMASAIDTIASYMWAIGDLLPTDTIWIIVLLVFAIEIVIMAFNTVAWLLHWKQVKG